MTDRSYLQKRLDNTSSLFRHDLLGHFGCVNALEFSKPGHLLASGGDDRRVLLWNINDCLDGTKQVPHNPMDDAHNSNVFCLSFNQDSTKIFSGGNDEMVLVHDIETKKSLDLFMHDEPVYGVDVNPQNENLFVTACSDGRVQLFDLRQPASEDPLQIAGYAFSFHSAVFNPQDPRLIATANQKYGLGLWDVRKPGKCVLEYGNPPNRSQTAMSVCFDGAGRRLLGLRRRLPPVVFNIESPEIVAEFDHPGYYNSCTMKSCSFAGLDDEYVMSGSDDFNLYLWKLPTRDETWVDRAHLVLRGHRSIVNQVRFNKELGIIASAGVEKVVKMWGTLPFCSDEDAGISQSSTFPKNRRLYSRQEYIELVVQGGSDMTHDYSGESIQENKRMIAFFDSLVQRDVEGLTSSDEDSLTDSAKNSGTDSDFEEELEEDPTDSDSAVQSRSGSANSSPHSNASESEEKNTRPTIRRLIALRRKQTMRYYRPKKYRKVDPEHIAKSLSNARSVIATTSSTEDTSSDDDFHLKDSVDSPHLCSSSVGSGKSSTSSLLASSSMTTSSSSLAAVAASLVPEALKVSPPAPSSNKDKVREEILLALQQTDVCDNNTPPDQATEDAIMLAPQASGDDPVTSPTPSASTATQFGAHTSTASRDSPAVVETNAIKFKSTSKGKARDRGYRNHCRRSE